MLSFDKAGKAVCILFLCALGACGGLKPLASTPLPRVVPAGPVPAHAGTPDPGVGSSDFEALWNRALMVPVEGLSPSDLQNNYDAGRGPRTHRAIDMMVRKGTAVLAADDGRIGRLGTTPLGGNIIYATDPEERFVYYYAHLDRHARGLSVGDRIRKGDVIGYVGSTGNASANAPHLHFQVMLKGSGRAWWDGPALNPWSFFVHPGQKNR